MKSTIFTFLLTLILTATVMAQSSNDGDNNTRSIGDVGNGGGRSESIGSQYLALAQMDIIKRPMTVGDFVKIDEMALMGDVGNGGGVARWLKRLKIRMSRRMNGPNRIEEIRLLAGRQYIFERSKIALSEFDSFALGHVAQYVFATYGSVNPGNIYAFYMLTNIAADKEQQISDLYAIELLDGTILLKDDLKSITVELYFGADE